MDFMCLFYLRAEAKQASPRQRYKEGMLPVKGVGEAKDWRAMLMLDNQGPIDAQSTHLLIYQFINCTDIY